MIPIWYQPSSKLCDDHLKTRKQNRDSSIKSTLLICHTCKYKSVDSAAWLVVVHVQFFLPLEKIVFWSLRFLTLTATKFIILIAAPNFNVHVQELLQKLHSNVFWSSSSFIIYFEVYKISWTIKILVITMTSDRTRLEFSLLKIRNFKNAWLSQRWQNIIEKLIFV